MQKLGPRPVWDDEGAEAFNHSEQAPPLRLKRGRLHEVIWMCWTGRNAMPAHLQLCLRTIRRNSGLPVVLVTPDNLLEYVPDPHPAYPFLHLAHRADYLRCYLLHNYGGIYLDCDTICLQSLAPLFDELKTCDAVGYDGEQWGEYIGISDMGPFRPESDLTGLWFGALHGKLQLRLDDITKHQTDVFHWTEILRDIFLPVSLMYKQKISKALQAINPEQAVLWSTEPYSDVMRSSLDKYHVLILNNAKYGHELQSLSEEDILEGPAVLSQILRRCLGMREPL